MSIPVANMNPAQLRDLLICPISYETFRDPMTEEEGTCEHTFERAHIQEWLADHKTCPMSRRPLTEDQLIPDSDLRNACALLDPNRVVPITQGELRVIRSAAQEFSQRIGGRVPQAVHDSIMRRVAAKVSEKSSDCKQKTEDFYRWEENSCKIL